MNIGNWLKEYFAKTVKGEIKKALQKGIAEAMDTVLALRPDDVSIAKARIKSGIQKQKKIGGTIRGWACDAVDALNAETIGMLLAMAGAAIDKM